MNKIRFAVLALVLLTILACGPRGAELPLAVERPGDAATAIAIGRMQSPEHAAALVDAALDPNRELRLAAIFALGQLGLAQGVDVPEIAVETCVRALDDDDPEIVTRALEALGKLAAPSTVERVTALLAHADPRVRAEAALALFRFQFAPVWREEVEEPRELPDESVAAIVALFGDADPKVRWAATYAFSRYGEPDATLELAAHLGDDNEWARLFAVRAIGRSGDETLTGVIRRATADRSPLVRTEAVQALAALGKIDEVPEAVVSDPSFHVRAAVARALAEATSDKTVEGLYVLQTDASPTVRTAAIASLAARLGSDFETTLRGYMKDEDWRVRAAAAGAADALGDDGLTLIEQGLADPDARVRTAALAVLGRMQLGEALIAQALQADDLAVRGTAVGLLAERDLSDELSLVRAAYDASPGVEWIEVREALVDAAVELDGSRSFLRRVHGEDPAPSVRQRAAQALGRRVEPSRPAGDPPVAVETFDENPIVVLETSKGVLEILARADQAPVHVSNFVKLVREGFYDGLIWHRVVSNFVIQGGDPRGDGWGGAGYTLRDEINTVRYGRGVVGMPKAGKDTGSCQIFITHVPTPHLDGNYTVFGQVISGLEVIDRIEVGDRILSATVQ